MSVKLFDSELKIMDVVWKGEVVTAKEIAKTMSKKTGWTKATTYTLIRRCIAKGAIERIEPNFVCHALIPQNEVREYETNELIEKLYDGAPDQLIASLLEKKRKLNPDEIDKLMDIIRKLE